MLRKRTYLRTFFAVIVLTMAGVAAFNYVVDPYLYFRAVRVEGLNARKPRPDANIAAVKLDAALRMQPSVVLLGNSRVDVGVDPANETWRDTKVYNLGIPGAGICSALGNLRALRSGVRLESILLGADFLDFLSEAPPGPCPGADDDLERLRLLERLRALATLTATQISIRTVLQQRDAYADEITDLGWSPMRNYEQIAAIDGYHAMFRQRAQETARALAQRPHRLGPQGHDSSLEFEALRAIVKDAAEHGTRLDIVIYPYHAQYLLMFEDLGLWPLFEAWKRRLIQIAESAGNAQVRVWDFSTLTDYQLESIPAAQDRSLDMRYYWEGGHFKKPLGDVMVSRIYGPADAVQPPAECDAFGVLITSSNVDGCLTYARAKLDSYRRQDGEMVREVAQITAFSHTVSP